MPQLSIHTKPGPGSDQIRFFEVHFGEPENPNRFVFDTHSAGFDGGGSIDWNGDTVESVVLALPMHLVTSETDRDALEIKETDQLPALFSLIRAEGETRSIEELCNYYMELLLLLPPDSPTLHHMPDVLFAPKAIQFRAAMENEYEDYARPLTVGFAYVDTGVDLVTIDMMLIDPNLSDESVFEAVDLSDPTDESAPTYDYAILTEQMAGFVNDYYNRYRKPTTKTLNLLKRYGKVPEDLTLKEFLAEPEPTQASDQPV